MAFHQKMSACSAMLIMMMMMLSIETSAARSYDSQQKVPCWCVALATADDTQLQAGIDYACAHTDCRDIQAGGLCLDPDNVQWHASFAYNSYIAVKQTPSDCYFNGTAGITTKNPSHGSCHFLNFLCTPAH
uniref:X8 domain-containing protein n=1 Tax=Kalanchoe fedtschenkoi TaxID=63787 RepID=A0A7N0UI57_KALFE